MSQITNISTSVLRVHPRNTEFFDDIEGDNYTQFKNSIKEDGIITPLIVASDMTIISGHQRYQAAKDLGITQVPVIIREDLEDEDEQLKKLLATNFGRMKNDPNKQRKVAVQYVELCGNSHGGSRGDNRHLQMSQKDIAQNLGVSERTLRELLEIERKLTPEIKELLDTGIISKTSASKIWTKLSESEQEELLQELGKDKIKAMTIKETKELMQEHSLLKRENEELRNRKPVEVVPDDYNYYKRKHTEFSGRMDELQSMVRDLNRDVEDKKLELEKAESEKSILERKAKLNEKEASKYNKLTKDIENLTREKDDIGRQIQAKTELSGLVVRIEHILKTELAPVKYSRAINEVSTDEIVINNLRDIVNRVQDWCNEMYEYTGDQNIIQVEVIDHE